MEIYRGNENQGRGSEQKGCQFIAIWLFIGFVSILGLIAFYGGRFLWTLIKQL